MIKKLIKVVVSLGIFFIVLLLTAAGITYFYQDELIGLFVKEANKKLNIPVNVKEIDVSLFDKFPNLAIRLTEIAIDHENEKVGRLENVYFTFNIRNLIQGEYKIDQVFFENGFVHLVRYRDGSNNYNIIKSDSSANNNSVNFSIEGIGLQNVEVTYYDFTNNFYINTNCASVKSKFNKNADDINFDVKGDLSLHQVKNDKFNISGEKSITLESKIHYNSSIRKLTILPSNFTYKKALFLVNGDINIPESRLDLKFDGEEANFESIITLLPDDISGKFGEYRSKGNMYFKGHLYGSYDNKIPAVKLDFGCRNASFFHPKYKKSVENVYLTGKFNNESASDLSSGHLVLKDINGSFEGEPFYGNLVINDFDKLQVDLKLKANIDVNSFLDFYPIRKINSADGMLGINIQFAGKLKNINSARDIQKSRSSGEVNLKDVNFRLTDVSLPFQSFNGHFLFKDDALGISSFNGKIGNSDFEINGLFRNVLSYLFLKNQPVIIEADLEAGLIDLDELLSGSSDVHGSSSSGYTFTISPRLDVDFNCKIDRVVVKRFEGRNIKGDLEIKNQKAVSSKLQIGTMGGVLTMNGSVDADTPGLVEVYTKSQLERIDIDSIFYVFENFNQDFLMDKHLSGQIYANVNTYLVMDNKLKLNTEKLLSDIELSIRNGELNQFEPMQKLSKYVDKDDLQHLKFSELKNQILVHNRQIHLPKMEVGTNITKIQVTGTHTFDQEIDYHLVIPIKKYRNRSVSQFGNVEEDDSGNLHLFLVINGTTKDYSIKFDTESLKTKIVDNIKDEGKELKNTFKNKGKKRKASKELNDEEFFDF